MNQRMLMLAILLLWSGSAHAQGQRALLASREASVMIVSKAANAKGSGALIGDRHVLTCFHVVASLAVQGQYTNFAVFKDLQVTLSSGETIDGEVVSLPTQADPLPLTQDFAVVRLKTKPTKPLTKLTLAQESEKPTVGDDVVFSGFPLGTPGMVTHRGMVSGFDPTATLIFVQASINKGNSGGALLNSEGKIVGIVSMREGDISSQGLGDLRAYIDRTTSQGSLQLMGVDPLQATRAIIQTLDQYISTGIGYARSIQFARTYINKNKAYLE